MRGATDDVWAPDITVGISIHAPHAGCDRPDEHHDRRRQPISIHAPHAGCDQIQRHTVSGGVDFNPRTPCGVRRH